MVTRSAFVASKTILLVNSAKSAMLFGILFSKFDSQTRLHHVNCSRSLERNQIGAVVSVIWWFWSSVVKQGYPNYCLQLSPTDKADACTGNPLSGIKGCEKIDEALPFLAQFFQLGLLVGSPADLFPGGVSCKSDGLG
ncbi:hypothetical protein RHMOL_Rhmol01G0203600 [Rhododendron molle]|uniref:Uncharacterized protein n=2 Tax=Rhododendron molle TaxID=49168 RepID=A0ACC0Q381_RHOML|nr:hypothetical protein RHMOL_Rhmol01G0203600 [Rhododendron molle]KAI8572494.1 hypothetical protein RHMOL_Rhmol01G0203600 [Rhododendron molle]